MTQRFRFIHAADLHLDTPFQGIGADDAEVAERLRDASLSAFDALIDAAVERDCALVVIAGDVYDGTEAGVRAQLRFAAGMRRLDAAGIEAVVVRGNHDPLGGWSAIGELPGRVHLLGADAVQAVPVRRDGAVLATVHGISYDRPDVTENLALRFEPAGGGLQVAVLHANVGAAAEHAPYSPARLSELIERGFDYWALGHIHRFAILHERPWVVYCGSLQGRSPRQSELGPKGAALVEVADGAVERVEPLVLDAARFQRIELAIDGVDDLEALRGALERAGGDARHAAEGRLVVLRAVLVGRGALHRDLQERAHREGLLAELRIARHPDLWWEALLDETRPALDREELRRSGSLAGAVFDRADEIEDPAAWLAAVADSELPAGVRARIDPLAGADAERVVDEAAELAAALLEEDRDGA